MTFQLDFRTILSSCVSVGIRSNLRRMSSSEYSTSSSRAREFPPEKQPPIFDVQVMGSPAQERKHGDPYRNRRRAQKATQIRLYWGEEMGVTFFARFPPSPFSFFCECFLLLRPSSLGRCLLLYLFDFPRGQTTERTPVGKTFTASSRSISAPSFFPCS